MPGLSDFGNIHWTATAFAYASLVSGLLSTYYAFYVQQILSELHNPDDVREWLLSPPSSLVNRFLNASAFLRRYRSQSPTKQATSSDDRIPSLTAAATLIAPCRLLRLSIMSLFVALGIYLGSVYTAKLGTLKGSNANLAVLLFFVLISALAILEVFIPMNNRQVDDITASLERNPVGRGFQLRKSDSIRHSTDMTAAIASSETSEIGGVIREALKASIRAQEENVKAQKASIHAQEESVKAQKASIHAQEESANAQKALLELFNLPSR